MNSSTLLSILIPTKNREEYTLKVIRQILSVTADDFQLVIQDNSDTNVLESKLSVFGGDKRLTYSYDSRLLSFVDNFSRGLDRCTGEYIIILGDDDGINPDIFAVAAWASQNNIDAITPSLPLVYFWPQSRVGSADRNGTLHINHFTGNIKTVQPKKILKRFMENGCFNYLAYDLAKAYHGLVKRSILTSVRDKTGRFIGGLTPDIYLSVAISSLAGKLIVIDYPLTISGICNKSGSSDSATGKHTGQLKDAPHFRGHDSYDWSSNVAPFYSVETIWADSALAALRDLGEKDILNAFNAKLLAVRCMKSYPEFRDLIVKHMSDELVGSESGKAMKKALQQAKLQMYLNRISRLKSSIVYRLSRAKKQKVLHNVKDIIAASACCEEYMKFERETFMKQLR